jgi:molybdate transport system substrate-binding protein
MLGLGRARRLLLACVQHRRCLAPLVSRALALACIGLCVLACSKTPATQEVPAVRVAAAASLTDAFSEIGRVFEEKHGAQVTFSFGSSGLLAEQLEQGAPFDVFAAANVSFIDAVVAARTCDESTKRPYAHGRIAVWTRRGAVDPPAALEDLADERFARIAIATPEHAPYGRAAKDALLDANLWTTLEPRIVYAENVRQTLQFAETGNVQAAIVALALVVNDEENPWILVEEGRHQPIEQALVVCDRGENRRGADAFAEFVASQDGRAILARHGFSVPGGAKGEP